MKFMKLGSKPDAFHAQEANSISYISSDLATDVTIIVGEVKFHLHKFPLLSKSNHFQKLVTEAHEKDSAEIHLPDFPGGPRAFEICAKFCYGMIVTIGPYNVMAARCGAEYLEMTEDVERGNLIFKIEVFLNSTVFRSWKDSIIVLQTTTSLLPWSEDLKVVGRCIDSIASKTSVDPSNINWSYTCNRNLDKIIETTTNTVPKDWWIEDICELESNLYKRVMIAVKSKGRMDANVIGEALKTYAIRWLPDSIEALESQVHQSRNKSLVETIICLLPSDKGVGCSCGFLLKLLKVAILVGVDDSAREDLVNRISLKLDEASVTDLLIPARSPQTTVHDVELVRCLVHKFVMHENFGQDFGIVEKNEDIGDLVLGHGSLLNVGKLIDGYLAEIAHDPNLGLSGFVELSELIPASARPIHDGLYWAIDIYLKEHPRLTKSERKKLCGLMDVKKLTMAASTHAAQNEQLPVRVVVQVLFFEQIKAAAGAQTTNAGSQDVSHSTTNTNEDLEKSEAEQCISLGKQMSQLKLNNENFQKNGKLTKKGSKNRTSAMRLLPSRSLKIFDKLWVVGKGHGVGENRSSETSGSLKSPASTILRGGMLSKFSSGSSGKDRRHSVS